MAECVCGRKTLGNYTFCSLDCADHAYTILRDRYNNAWQEFEKSELQLQLQRKEIDELRYSLAHTTSASYKRRKK